MSGLNILMQMPALKDNDIPGNCCDRNSPTSLKLTRSLKRSTNSHILGSSLLPYIYLKKIKIPSATDSGTTKCRVLRDTESGQPIKSRSSPYNATIVQLLVHCNALYNILKVKASTA